MQTQSTQVLIIGGGPGGYVAAIRAAQHGLSTTLVEADSAGGTCLNIGCIPSKALIHAADEFHRLQSYDGRSPLGIQAKAPAIDIARTVEWKDGIVGRLTSGVAALLKKHGVAYVKGWARVLDGKTAEIVSADDGQDKRRVSCEHLVLATGSLPVELPSLPFGGPVIDSARALSPTRLPGRLAIVGAGYIGLELGTVYRKLGVAVDVIEAQDRILPAYDAQLVRPVQASLERLGVRLHLATRVQGFAADSGGLVVRGSDDQEAVVAADQVLVAVGRKPRTQGWGLETLAVDMDGPWVRVDDQCRTSMRNVWAIGDLTGEPMLAHRAMAQGEMVADIIAGRRRHFHPAAIPAVCFTDPEIVVAGLSPQVARDAGEETLEAQFPLAANGRAMTLDATDGFVRVVARRADHVILGWQAVGGGVSELATAFSQSLEMGARLDDVAGSIHAHPTLGEAVQEAAMRALGHSLHI